MDLNFFLHIICANVLFPVLLSIYYAASSTTFILFQTDSYFDGYRCKPSGTVFELKRSNLLSCAMACFMNNFCYSVFYQQESGVCIGCDDFYHTLERFNRSQYVGRYSGACPPGWIEKTETCYYISSGKTNWANAQNECKRMGGGLFDLDDAFRSYNNDHPLLEIVDFRDYWLDLKYDPESGEFIQASTGTEVVLGQSMRQGASADRPCIYYSLDIPDHVFVSCQNAYNFICKRY